MNHSPFDREQLRTVIRQALAEDLGGGDATTQALVPAGDTAHAYIVPRREYVLAGIEVAAQVFQEVSPQLQLHVMVKDGTTIFPGQRLMQIEGPAQAILIGERLALNFLQHLTGVATLTARYVALAAPYGTQILDTRKTLPGLRALQKYAVRCGGGVNHRFGLYDRILIKDNHLAFWMRHNTPDLAEAVRAARQAYPGLAVEIEVETEAAMRAVLPAAPDWILLDNMPLETMRRCVALCPPACKVEASGGITLETVAAVAATGVHAISIGSLTHSASAADLSLEFYDTEPITA